MSVYTVVERHELEAFLADYDVGPLLNYSGITAGIENTNYFVTTVAGAYVLTLFEFTPASELPFFLALMAHLAEHGVPSAHPLADRAGRYLRELNGRPAALVMRLPGASVAQPEIAHCRAIGSAMARMHLATLDFTPRRDNERGAAWRASTARVVAPRLDEADAALLWEAVREFAEERFTGLPGGVIHADLFRDNALFEGQRLTGLIDFYYAHSGAFIYDLAVAVADWCFDDDKVALQGPLAAALLGAYAEVRSLLPAERAAWMMALRAAGLRFWLSRLKDMHFPRDGELVHIKDPQPFKRVLLCGRGAAGQFEKLLP
ncbi:MAG: homoserine kinase [Gammaproteobacteria bacterium]|nr:homoserine kinase [Gammaproteobacteria bacterium]